MEVVIEPDAGTASTLVAELVAAELRENPRTILGLATGRTMERVYAHLVRLHRHAGLDFSQCTTFNLDEYIGLPAEHPASYRAYMQHHLFAQVNVDLARTHLPDGMARDTLVEGARYEELIRACGGIRVQLLGIGETGHIGFNEPGSALTSRTRAKVLASGTRAQNAEMFGNDPAAVPTRAMTMGVGTILEAGRLILLATGPRKARVVAQALEGPLTAMVTGSAIQMHARATVILDAAAASDLTQRKYYDEASREEPVWRLLRAAAQARIAA